MSSVHMGGTGNLKFNKLGSLIVKEKKELNKEKETYLLAIGSLIGKTKGGRKHAK